MTTRQPRPALRPGRGRGLVAGITLALSVLLTACTPGGQQTGDGRDSSPAPTSTSTATGSATVPAPVRPEAGACYRLTFEEAVAPESSAAPVGCSAQHTAQTFHVGRLDLVRDGHLLATDSELARSSVTRSCRDRLARHLGGDPALSMLASVWFVPGAEDSDAGASWFRCDVVALAREDTLAPLPRRTAGLLSGDGAAEWAMCGTQAPGTKGFRRIPCSRPHTWRALRTVPLPGQKYPSPAQVAEAMEGPCRDAARDVADDPLDVDWSEEAPTRDQWQAGRRHGLCWAPA